MEVLKSTNFLNIVTKEKQVKETQQPEDTTEKETSVTVTPVPEKTTPVNPKERPGPAADKENPEENPSGIPEKEAPAPALRVRNAKLYFIDVNKDGQINLKSVIRPVNYTDSPLTETMRALIGGLLPSELNMELMTLIPEHTELRSVKMSGGTAFLDFNESFRFNSLGKEGHIAQLKQIIYTVTEFPTVKNVQILIEGNQEEYLGPEGVYIGKPLTRESF